MKRVGMALIGLTSTIAPICAFADDGSARIEQIESAVRQAGAVAALYKKEGTDEWCYVAFDGQTRAMLVATPTFLKLRDRGGEEYEAKSPTSPFERLPARADGARNISESYLEHFVTCVVFKALLDQRERLELVARDDGFEISGEFHRGQYSLKPGSVDAKFNPLTRGVYVFDRFGRLLSKTAGIPSRTVRYAYRKGDPESFGLVDHRIDEHGTFRLSEARFFETAPAELFDVQRIRGVLLEHAIRPASRKRLVATAEEVAAARAGGESPKDSDGSILADRNSEVPTDSRRATAVVVVGITLIVFGLLGVLRRWRS